MASVGSRLKYHFSEAESQADVQSSLHQRYTLDRGINTSRVAHFIVEGHEEALIDLTQCYLKTVFEVRKGNGEALTANPTVFLTPQYGSNLWSQASVYLNNTQLASGNDYPYTALFIDMLGACPDFRVFVTSPLSGWSDSSYGTSSLPVQLDRDPTTYDESKTLLGGSKKITVYDRIHSDFLMSCSQLIPNRMQLSLTLTRGKDSFVLGRSPGDTEEYVINIVSVSLFVKRVYLNSSARAIVNSSLGSGGKLHYQRLNTIAYPCPKDSKTWTWHNCFNNIAPRRVFMAFVTQMAYFGGWDRVSSFLESADVQTVRFCLDGKEIMAEPYSTDFQYDKEGVINVRKSDGKSAFAGLNRVVDAFSSPRSLVGVSYDCFLNGFTLFAVDLDHADSLGPVSGSLDIHVEFAHLTKEPYMVLVMGEYPKTISFDTNRQVTEM